MVLLQFGFIQLEILSETGVDREQLALVPAEGCAPADPGGMRIFMWPYMFVAGPNKPNDLLVPHVSMKRVYSTEMVAISLYGISGFDTNYSTVIINAIIRPESRCYLAASCHLSRSQRPGRTLSVFRSLIALVIRTSLINGGLLPRSVFQYLDR